MKKLAFVSKKLFRQRVMLNDLNREYVNKLIPSFHCDLPEAKGNDIPPQEIKEKPQISPEKQAEINRLRGEVRQIAEEARNLNPGKVFAEGAYDELGAVGTAVGAGTLGIIGGTGRVIGTYF